MDFSIKSADSKNSLATIKTDCILVGVYEDKKLTSEAAELDNQGIISNALKNGDIDGKPGSSLLLREEYYWSGLGKNRKSVKRIFASLLTPPSNHFRRQRSPIY